MDQPLFRRNAAGEIEEYQPVKAPSREVLQADFDAAAKGLTEADAKVKSLEKSEEQLKINLEAAYKTQEAALEYHAFRKARLAGYDAVSTVDKPVDDGATSPVAQDDAAPEPVAGQPTAEDVAASIDEPASADEPAGEVEVPIRRRSHA